MQLLEGVLIFFAAFALLSLVLPSTSKLSIRSILVFTACIFLVHAVVDGIRWQLFPAYIVLLITALFSLKASVSPVIMRILGASISAMAIASSLFLTTQFPVGNLPEPTGPYWVGTFSSAMVDESRVERYEPELNRGVSIQAWYPSSISEPGEFQRQPLFKELYSGEYDLISFLFGYLDQVKTHSYIDAPISTSEAFPVLVFNHGLFMPADQSPQLMEHLASHGYIVISIAHPFESLKVSLPDRGSRNFSMEYPLDVGFSSDEISDGGIGDMIGTVTGIDHSNLISALYEQMDIYDATAVEQRPVLLGNVVELPSLEPLGPLLTEQNVSSFFDIRTRVRNRSIEYWVEDIQFVIDDLKSLITPLEGWSNAVDNSKVGAIGYSYGGAAVGEFCKIDARCVAGSNLDGTQFGFNWEKPVQAPFLLVNTDTNPRGNNYAYYPPLDDFIDLLIPGTEHQDLMDSVVLFPILRTLGLSGEREYQDLADIVKDLELAFFDEYLKERDNTVSSVLEKHAADVTTFTYAKALQ